MFKILRVQGTSMLPVLKDGDFIVLSTWKRQIRQNAKLVFHHSIYGVLVKQVHQVIDEKSFTVKSTHHQGLSTEQMGVIHVENILGHLLFTVKKP
ncbi:MAG: S24 family peptidase [Pseudomonadota bacterium]|nr:S24 family peptidase [Pseudomonadota bacterium]